MCMCGALYSIITRGTPPFLLYKTLSPRRATPPTLIVTSLASNADG